MIAVPITGPCASGFCNFEVLALEAAHKSSRSCDESDGEILRAAAMPGVDDRRYRRGGPPAAPNPACRDRVLAVDRVPGGTVGKLAALMA